MKTLRIKKSLRFDLTGRPADRVEDCFRVGRVGLVCDRIPFIRPKMLVKPDDRGNIGTPLFADKTRPELKFVSPGGGTVSAVNFGPRRVLESVVIAIDDDESYEDFGKLSASDLASISADDLTRHLIKGGMWPCIRALPFRNIADPGRQPPAIWINIDGDDPFQPRSDIYLKDNLSFFETGLAALRKLTKAVYVCAAAEVPFSSNGMANWVTHRISGGYPANDPGVALYHTRKSPEDNRAWFTGGQDVVRIGRFLATGHYPTEQMIAVSAPEANDCRHVKTRIGAPLADLVSQAYDPVVYQWITGGIFAGSARGRDGFLGINDASLFVSPALRVRELFSFLRPGFDRPTHSRAFLSVLKRSPFPVDTDMHGEERACINCGSCTRVCPVDILPQFAYKAIYADEIEEALKHGLLDCVECGLCAYVCPSKIELSQSLIAAKQRYFMERD
jgi:Na+-transporting NADH:ubiquinone oxidoreductase subunit A